MSDSRKVFTIAYWLMVLAMFAATVTMLFTYTPVETTMGPAQKIFYLHLPVAINAFLACFVVFVASIGYLWQRRMWWDDLAAAGGKVAVLLCTIVLLTGMTWGHYAWNTWWTWSPRLTLSLVLWILFVVFVMIRPAIESPQRRAVVSAVYGVSAFLDVPLVYLSVKLMPEDVHPPSITLEPSMKLTLLAWFLPVTLMTAGLIATRFKLNRRIRSLDERNMHDGSRTVSNDRVGESK